MKDKSAKGGAGPEQLTVSGPTVSPWLQILKNCSIVAAAAVVVMIILALIFSGTGAAGSVVFGAVVVGLFFALSLVVGHIYGRKNPSGAIGVFMVTYLVKVVGFAAALFALGAPSWLHGIWFSMAALVVVVLWQATEIFTFGRQRHQIFDDDVPAHGGSAKAAGNE